MVGRIIRYAGRRVVPPQGLWKRLLWLLFGNADDGVLGDWAWNLMQHDNWRIRIRWWLRNPFHNLAFYGLGVAHKSRTAFGRRPEDDPSVVFRFGRSNRCYTVVDGSSWHRPFWSSWRHGWQVYAGWRPNSGAFGLKCRRESL